MESLPQPAPASTFGDIREVGPDLAEAYYARLERLLDAGARQACSAWSFVEPDVREQYVDRLRADLANGHWDERHGALRRQTEMTGSLILVRAAP